MLGSESSVAAALPPSEPLPTPSCKLGSRTTFLTATRSPRITFCHSVSSGPNAWKVPALRTVWPLAVTVNEAVAPVLSTWLPNALPVDSWMVKSSLSGPENTRENTKW